MELKSLINAELSLFPEKFFNLHSALKSQKQFEEKMGFPVSDLLSKQKNSDVAKKVLGKSGYNACLAIYFNQFDTKDGFDTDKLLKDLEGKAQVYKRHLGSDKFQLLKVLCRVSKCAPKEVEAPVLKLVPQGLLGI